MFARRCGTCRNHTDQSSEFMDDAGGHEAKEGACARSHLLPMGQELRSVPRK